MRFSFDSKQYRDNLAKDLRKNRNEGKRAHALEQLKKERQTLAYTIAADIKKVLNKMNVVEGDHTSSESGADSEEISVDFREMKGNDGEKHLLEVRTYDISRSIPDELNLFFDVHRLITLDAWFEDVGVGKYDKFKSGIRTRNVRTVGFDYTDFGMSMETPFANVVNRMFERVGEIFGRTTLEVEQKTVSYVLKYLKLIKDSGKWNDMIFNRIGKEYVNQITEGMFLNRRYLSHVVGGLVDFGGWDTVAKEGAGSPIAEERHRAQRYPHKQEGGGIYEEVFDINKPHSDFLYFNVGGANYFDPRKILIICDSKNERFKKEVQSAEPGTDYDEGTYYGVYEGEEEGGLLTMDELLDTYDNPVDEFGLLFSFKREESWIYLADMIVDLYHGRLIIINEKEDG